MNQESDLVKKNYHAGEVQFSVVFFHPFGILHDDDDDTKDDRHSEMQPNWKMHFNYHLQHVNIPLDF